MFRVSRETLSGDGTSGVLIGRILGPNRDRSVPGANRVLVAAVGSTSKPWLFHVKLPADRASSHPGHDPTAPRTRAHPLPMLEFVLVDVIRMGD
jgi:hypothetical protein